MEKGLGWAIIILSLVGIADTAYLSYGQLSGSSLSCSFIEGCDTVLTSPYALLFGSIPLAYLGFAFYLALFALGVALFIFRTPLVRRLLLALASLGLISSLYFSYLQAFVIEAFCVYCLLSAILSVLLFFISLLLYREGRRLTPTAGQS
jgi:uncharacterized membrane protein